jgi:hypothetical protein
MFGFWGMGLGREVYIRENAHCSAGFRLLDPVAVAQSRGFRSRELSEIMRIVRESRQLFLEKWNEHLGR